MAGSKSVFLSYASQDGEAAQMLAEALRQRGIEVWHDQSDLRGGDAWDQRIRRQIKDCRLFIPLISKHAADRAEGYFRLEWKLAIDRAHYMALDQAFLLPVVIDDVTPSEARVPQQFHEYQWTRLPGAKTTPQFLTHVIALLNESAPSPVNRASPSADLHAAVAPEGTKSPKRSWLLVLPVVFLLIVLGLVLARHFDRPPVPYSDGDRRMTFAVLPFSGPTADDQGMRIAAAATQASVAALQRNPTWAKSVEYNLPAESGSRGFRDVAKSLNVHFLIRGTVSKEAEGYTVDLTTLDGGDESALGNQTLKIPAGSLLPVRRDDIDDVFGDLIFFGLKAEVARVASKPEAALDVRDLTFRAYVYRMVHYSEPEQAYRTADRLLEEALQRSPQDVLALILRAETNLCDCISAWAHDTEKERAIGIAMVEQLTTIDRVNPHYSLRCQVALLRSRWDELLVLTDGWLIRDPEDLDPLFFREHALLRLGRVEEALSTARLMVGRNPADRPDVAAYLAGAEYAGGRYEDAAKHARYAIARMSEAELKSASDGAIRLTLAASEAQLHRLDQAKVALADFWTSVPQAKSLDAIRNWMYPTAVLYGYEPLFDGLRAAGVE